MRMIHTSSSVFEINNLQLLIQNAGIECVVRQNEISSLMGGVGFTNVWPELHVVNEEEYDRAMIIVASFIKDHTEQEATEDEWICGGCGEVSAGQFLECWKCGSQKGGPSDA